MRPESAGAVVVMCLAVSACGGSIAARADCGASASCADPPSVTPAVDRSGGGDGSGGEYVPPIAPPPAEPIDGELVRGLTAPWQLAVDAANVYFGVEKKIMACRKSGCGGAATELAAVEGNLGGIVSDDAEVFWTDSAGRVMACAAAGCGRRPRVVATVDFPGPLAIANGVLYWTTNTGLVQRCAKRCTTPETIATDVPLGFLAGITVSGTDVYWTVEGDYDGSGPTGAVRTCSIEGPCVPRTLAARQNAARSIAVRAGTMAWVADGESTVRRCSLPACSDATSMPLAGQLGLAMDDKRIYFSFASNAYIQMASHDGGGMAPLVSGQKATYLAADATHLYWINTDIADSRGGVVGTGAIMSMRRPP